MPKKCQSNLSFNFTDNRLSIHRNGTSIYEITVWPKPKAEARDTIGNWTRSYPVFRIISYPLRTPKKKSSPQLELGLELIAQPPEMTRQMAYDQLRQSMPFAYAIALAPFRSHQWRLIILLSMKHQFYDLLKSNPVLAYYLANNERIMSLIYNKALMMETLTGMKQTELLDLLQLPQTKSAVKLLRKVHPASVSPEQSVLLRKCLQSEALMKRLAHLKSVNIGVLKLAFMPDDQFSSITPQLLEEVSADVRNNFHPAAANLFSAMVYRRQRIYPGRPLPVIRSLEDLDARHEEIMNEYTNRQTEKYLGPLPTPPVKGTTEIVPLRSGAALREEGEMQHNCVGGYAGAVRARRTYIYRVLAPERATLSIVRGGGGEWIIGQLKAAFNKPVKDETVKAVEDWLYAPQLGI